MPQDTFEFHISVRRLIIGLLITIVPISLLALYTISTTTDDLEEAIGSHFRTIAEVTAIDLAQFIRDRVKLVTLIAAVKGGAKLDQFGGGRIDQFWGRAAEQK